MRPKKVHPEEMKAQITKSKRILFPRNIRITKKVKRIMARSNKQGHYFGKKWYPQND